MNLPYEWVIGLRYTRAGKRGSRKRSAPEDRDAEEEHDGPPAKSNSSGRKGGARKKR